jgi:hypothetical protein
MTNYLKLPDGSAIESQYVKAITWDRSHSPQEGRAAFIRIYGYKSSSGLGFGGSTGLEQIHFVAMPTEAAAKKTCEELVAAWTGTQKVEA